MIDIEVYAISEDKISCRNEDIGPVSEQSESPRGQFFKVALSYPSNAPNSLLWSTTVFMWVTTIYV